VNSTSPKHIDRYDISDRCLWTGGICWVIYTGQALPTPPFPHSLTTFEASRYGYWTIHS
jgi:hypothetical protein